MNIEAFGKKIAKEAGSIIMDCFHQAQVHQKASNNLVTEADLRAEEYIVEQIKVVFPHHDVLSEEKYQSGDLEAESIWVIDPLDGTNNFAHGIPQFAVSIAYLESGTPKVGVVYDPYKNEMFSAVKGEGAFLNGKSIVCSKSASLQESIVATGFYYDRGQLMVDTLKAIETLFKLNIRGLRRMGAAALDLAWLACGRLDAYFEYRLNPWDWMAGAIIVEEAGGIIESCDGMPSSLKSKGLICSNNRFHGEFRDAVIRR